MGSIFDEIDQIKNADKQSKKKGKNNIGEGEEEKDYDPGFTMSDVPFNLAPTSIIIEILEHLDNLKKDVVKAHEKETEYAETLKSIKYGYMVEKSSETLSLILSSYQK